MQHLCKFALSSSDVQALLSEVSPNRIESSLTSLTVHLFVSTFITTFGLLVFFISTLTHTILGTEIIQSIASTRLEGFHIHTSSLPTILSMASSLIETSGPSNIGVSGTSLSSCRGLHYLQFAPKYTLFPYHQCWELNCLATWVDS